MKKVKIKAGSFEHDGWLNAKQIAEEEVKEKSAPQMKINLFCGDSLEVLKGISDNCIDSVVCDPPYGLSKEPNMMEVLNHWMNGDDYKHSGGGFMGKKWDSFVPGPAIWRECLRVLKPGGHLLAFFGSRTYDMGTLAIRLAGFEIRDQIMWVYGSGFPKSLDVSKAIDKAGPPGQVPFAEFAEHYEKMRKGSGMSHAEICAAGGWHGAINHGGSSANWSNGYGMPTTQQWEILQPLLDLDDKWSERVRRVEYEREVVGKKTKARSTTSSSALPTLDDGEVVYKSWDVTIPNSKEAKAWEGWGTALKPAHEPICVARKPLAGTVAANVLAHGTAGLNIDGCRVGSVDGRWPANLAHDGSDEVLANFPDAKRQQGLSNDSQRSKNNVYGSPTDNGKIYTHRTDNSKSAARFFYCAKASKADRNYGLSGEDIASADLVGRNEGSAGMENPRAGAGRTSGSKNPHPTVKPIALMDWLVRLVTPPGGMVLDPFMGSGSTGVAAMKNGFKFSGIELDENFYLIASERISFAADESNEV